MRKDIIFLKTHEQLDRELSWLIEHYGEETEEYKNHTTQRIALIKKIYFTTGYQKPIPTQAKFEM